MRKSILAVSICLLAMPIAAQAEELRTVSSLDYALNDYAYLGQTLKLCDCRISHVSTQARYVILTLMDQVQGIFI
ncbi:hypothetical protein N5853_07520 [Bartonella sp. HY329]|uniref:hypothetical protein n=1 Tax=unclassified Bartonella TaxID=2645622 RepID=UPI0021C78DD4|nr:MULTISPECIES: hypothetical protein [unclassified Bartonella]UXM93977.1 hypothetical protein N5853_07520 [Bartonella sp. HY329]UXN08298.1 hypothetical protein N5852_07530 [Bartonella sp. HY328]